MKRILIPTDFSVESESAKKAAIAISKKTGAEIHFLNVVEPVTSANGNFSGQGSGSGMDNVFELKLMEVALRNIKKQALSSDLMDIKSPYFIKVGEIYKVVLDYIKEHDIDLVVMGSTGSDGVEELLIGSNAERIVRLSPVPVLVMKGALDGDFSISKIAFATNLEAEVSKVVTELKKFQEAFSAEILLVNINTPNNFYRSGTTKRMLEEFATKHHLSNYTTYNYSDNSEEDGILAFAEEMHADLIAMGTHGRTGFAHLLSGSLAEDVVNHSKKPVLTIKMK